MKFKSKEHNIFELYDLLTNILEKVEYLCFKESHKQENKINNTKEFAAGKTPF
jgi:uncharacterized spore protein YtfJ